MPTSTHRTKGWFQVFLVTVDVCIGKGVRFYVNVKSVHALGPKRSYNAHLKEHFRQSPSPRQMGIQFIAYLDCGERGVMCGVFPPLDVRASVGSQWVVGVEKICSSKVGENLPPIFGVENSKQKYWKRNHLVNQKPLPNVRNLNFPETFFSQHLFGIPGISWQTPTKGGPFVSFLNQSMVLLLLELILNGSPLRDHHSS